MEQKPDKIALYYFGEKGYNALGVENYISQRLLELCDRYKMSRYQLSLRTGISQSALSDIIKKKSVPTVFTIEKLCDGFGISLAQFFSDESNQNLTDEQEEILRLWNRLTAEEKRFIKICIKGIENER